MKIKEILKNTEFLGGFEDKYLDKIVPLCSEEHYGAGDIVFTEGSESDNFYILVDGAVSLEKKGNQTKIARVELEGIERGDAFGWSGLIEPHEFAASTRCLTDCDVVSVKGNEVLKIMDENPEFGLKLAQRLALLLSSRMTYARENLTKGLSQMRLDKEI